MPLIKPRMNPAMKPPPNMRLITAAGKTTTLPMIPWPPTISIEPRTRIVPRTIPIMISAHGGKSPKKGIHGNMSANWL